MVYTSERHLGIAVADSQVEPRMTNIDEAEFYYDEKLKMDMLRINVPSTETKEI